MTKIHTMDTTFGLLTALIALGIIFTRKSEQITRILTGVGFIALQCYLMSGFGEDSSVPMIHYTLSGIIVLALVASFVPGSWMTRGGVLIPLIPALIPIGAKAVFQGFDIQWSFATAMIIVAGALIYFIQQVKVYFGKRWFSVEEETFGQSILLILTGFLAFTSVFLFSTFGLILLATGIAATGLALRKNTWVLTGLSVLSLAWILFAVNSDSELEFLFLKGNFWMGTITGAGLLLLHLSGKGRNLLISYLIPMVVALIFIGLGKINPNFGGLPTLLGLILGYALGQVVLVSQKVSYSGQIAGLLLLFAGFTGPVNEWMKQEKVEIETLIDQPVSGKEEAKKDPLDIDGIALDASLNGNWTSAQENSKLEFELGPKGSRTTGAIKKFQVETTVSETSLTNLKVIMEAGSLTTYDPYRDESVLSEEFIHAEKYPKIIYQSSNIEQVGDVYKIQGELAFMGIKQAVDLELKFVSKVEKDGTTYLVFVGKSLVNRTAHGMQSDAKIGDLVDVTFEIALKK